MSHLEKLRKDVEYWQKADREARETLEFTEKLLPDMERRLAELESRAPSPPIDAPAATETSVPSVNGRNDASTSRTEDGESDGPRFTGECVDQVEQALEWKSPQSSKDLEANLAKYGKSYGLGAIGYALRELRKRGRINEAQKVGNLRYYRIIRAVSLNPADFGPEEEDGRPSKETG